MRRYLALLSCLLGLLLSVLLVLAALGDHRDRERVYSVAQVEAELARQPDGWPGRTLLLRAVAEPCPVWGSPNSALHCREARPIFVDHQSPLTDPLPISWQQQSPLLVFLRGVPLLSQIVPTPHVVAWGVLATYRVEIRARPCGAGACYEALLLDAAPDALEEG